MKNKLYNNIKEGVKTTGNFVKNNLGKILLTGTLIGCGLEKEYPKYIYKGNIEGEAIEFKQKWYIDSDDKNLLAVKKENGKIIEYLDNENNDLLIEGITILEHGTKKIYSNYYQLHKPIIKKGQEQFDNYLKKIMADKANTLQETKKAIQEIGEARIREDSLFVQRGLEALD